MARHQALFAQYLADLTAARTLSEAWWESLLDEEARQVGSRAEAVARVSSRWPSGPVSHPYVIKVFRQYFLACDRLNREVEKESVTSSSSGHNESDWGIEDRPSDTPTVEQPVPPIVFVVDWLSGKHEDLLVFMSDLAYSPVGLEAGGYS